MILGLVHSSSYSVAYTTTWGRILLKSNRRRYIMYLLYLILLMYVLKYLKRGRGFDCVNTSSTISMIFLLYVTNRYLIFDGNKKDLLCCS